MGDLLEQTKKAFGQRYTTVCREMNAEWPDFKAFDKVFHDNWKSLEFADAKQRQKSNNSPRQQQQQQQSGKPASSNTKQPTKQARKWADKISKEEAKSLDYSDDKVGESLTGSSNSGFIDENTLKIAQSSKGGAYEVPEMEQQPEQSTASSGWFDYFTKQLTGEKTITDELLRPVLDSMEDHLVNKNVAKDISSSLCQSVSKELLGKKTGTGLFSSGSSGLKAMVSSCLQQALSKILTPSTSTDLLREINQKRKQGPYVISFIGVNGVGKSTNLSKVCFWLLQNKYRILIAACDTFRSGAVEQLRTHVRNLQSLSGSSSLELFERGYGKDAATIAREAISYAKSESFDIVLIDTAGRMQDNEPLMRSLAKVSAIYLSIILT